MAKITNLFSGILHPKKRRELKQYFEMLEGYTPIFTTFDGGVYEMELTRSCIHAFATHVSKLQPHVVGPDRRGLDAVLNGQVNPWMLSSQFLYKCATLYEAKNTLVILPLVDAYDRTVGYYPANYQTLEIMDVDGEAWLRIRFPNGKTTAFEVSRCGICSKYLYKSDLIGEDNRVLSPTMQLLNMQNQGIAEGIKNSASFRFMATVSNWSHDEELKKKRQKFVEEAFGEGAGGLALFPNTFKDVKQIVSTPRVVDPEQMRLIQDRVFNYFGSNEDILKNKAVGDAWAAYYEGKIEPFTIQLSQAMSAMTYSLNEHTRGNGIFWSSNRLQYMTTVDKLNVSSQMFDRGVLTQNDIRDIWNLPHVDGGDKFYIRKEYAEVSKIGEESQEAVVLEPQGEEGKEENNADT